MRVKRTREELLERCGRSSAPFSVSDQPEERGGSGTSRSGYAVAASMFLAKGGRLGRPSLLCRGGLSIVSERPNTAPSSG